MATQKKTSTSKPKSSSSALSLHPPYLQMITEAIKTMKDRTGSSQPSIAKYIEENYTQKQLPPNFRKMLSMQLKRFVKSEKLVKVKNSYKIPPSTEKAKKPSNPPKEKKSPIAKKKVTTKVAVAKKSLEKAKKTKRLSQVKTPEGFKKVKSPVKIGEGRKKAVKADMPAKRKAVSSIDATPKKKGKK